MPALVKDALGFVHGRPKPKKVLRQDEFGIVRLFPADKGRDLPTQRKYGPAEGEELSKTLAEYGTFLASRGRGKI